MRPSQLSNIENSLQKRKKVDNEPHTKQAILDHAKMLDVQGQETQFFYNSTIQKPSAVTKAIKARFTYSGIMEGHGYKLETNLVTFCSNILRVYTIGESSVDFKTSKMFNDKILDVVKVPTHPFITKKKELQQELNMVSEPKLDKDKVQHQSSRSARANRRSREVEKMIDTAGEQNEEFKEEKAQKIDEDMDEENPDYLFLITNNFNCALLCFSKGSMEIEVVSRGNIAEKLIHERKEPPYPIFLGQSGTYIALMLYHNLLKIVPLVKSSYANYYCSLTHATSVRVRHSNVLQVVPLLDKKIETNPQFGVLYQKTQHMRVPGTSGPPALQVKIELEKYNFDRERSDLSPINSSSHGQNQGKLDFQSSSVYKVEPLVFGGFLAFDVDTVSYCRMDMSPHGVFQTQLKSPNQVTAICQVDDYQPSQNVHILRYLFATESGELFMLAFNMNALSSIIDPRGKSIDQRVIEKLMTIEFLASKLTFCSSLVYLDNSLVFYSSKEGDSFILRICPEHQGSKEQPYIQIEQRFQSLAPIMDMQLAKPECNQGQQSELVVVTGWNHQTHMNLVKQGVGLKSIYSFESAIPRNLVREFLTIGDRIFMRMHGYDLLIGVKTVFNESQDSRQIQLQGFDLSRNVEVKKYEQILAFTQITVRQRSIQEEEVKASDNKEEIIDQEMKEEGQVQPEQVIDPQIQNEDKEENKSSMHEANTTSGLKDKSMILFAKSSEIKLLSDEGEVGGEIVARISPEDQQSVYTHVKALGTKVIAASRGGLLQLFEICNNTLQFKHVSSLKMETEISAISLVRSDLFDFEIAYVSLQDYPFYSLNVIDLESMKIVSKLSLHSHLEPTQIKSWFEHKLIREGKVFDLFQKDDTTQVQDQPKEQAPEMLQNLPKEGEQMQPEGLVEQNEPTTIKPELTENLNTQISSSVAISIEHILVDQGLTDQVICGFSNGKLMQINFDMKELAAIIREPNNYPPITDIEEITQKQLLASEGIDAQTNAPFWGVNVCYVGTVLPKLSKIMTDKGEAVIACCDKPVVFYEVNDSLEMHYLAFNHIRNVACLTFDSGSPIILYEDQSGVLHLSENDSLKKLQIQRMVFRMQVSKTLLSPNSDSIVALLEQPNLDYIDQSKKVFNAVGLISRSTLRTKALLQLQKSEIANCACHIQSNSGKQFILLGTTYLRPEEQIPSSGRLILLDAENFELLQHNSVKGSVQSLLVVKELKLLIAGVNNTIEVYDLQSLLPTFRNQQISKQGKLDLLDKKVSGTFIQSIVQLPQVRPDSKLYNPLTTPVTIVVGDMAGHGVSTFELKETRQSRVKIMESAGTHISMWVNNIVALSESQFIVFDQEGNMYVFQKNLAPTCTEEKLKLTLRGSYCIGEEVQSATFGTLRVMSDASMGPIEIEKRLKENTDSMEKNKVKAKKKAYVRAAAGDGDMSKQMITRSQEMAMKVDVEMNECQDEEEEKHSDGETKMIVTRSSVIKQQQSLESLRREIEDCNSYHRLLSDINYARVFAEKTLEEMLALQESRTSIIYGTTEGSIGQLFSISPKVYILLQLLQSEMDQQEQCNDLVRQKRVDYRRVKQAASISNEIIKPQSPMLNGIIDGDFIEMFLDMPKSKQLELTKGVTNLGGPGDEEFTDTVKQIIILLLKSK